MFCHRPGLRVAVACGQRRCEQSCCEQGGRPHRLHVLSWMHSCCQPLQPYARRCEGGCLPGALRHRTFEAMKESEFERRFLDFVYRTELAITPGALAYYADIPISEATSHLEK